MPQDLVAFMQQKPPPLQRKQRQPVKRKAHIVVEISSDEEDIEDVSSEDEVKQQQPKRAKRVEISSEAWADKYAPVEVKDVAIHAKKLQQVQKAMSRLCDQQDSLRLLVMSGPAGSAKSTVIKAASREYGYKDRIIEWSSPDRVDGSSIVEAFGEFLNGLCYTQQRKSLILVEDLPNIMHLETKQAFVNSLLQWVSVTSSNSSSLPPLVLCITEVDPPDATSWTDAVITERILPRRLLDHPKVERIKTQPTNMTLTSKVLKSIAVKENLAKVIPKKELDMTIKEVAQFGDIRSSISALEFWARWRSYSDSVPPFGREAHLNLFHAIGRVIYGSSRDKQGNLTKPDGKVVDSVLQDWEQTNRDATLSLSIHENLPAAHSSRLSLECFEQSARHLSDSEVLIARDMSILASEFAVRGVRTEIRRHPADESLPKSHRQSVYPREKKLAKARMASLADIEKYVSQRTRATGNFISRGNAVLLDGPFELLAKRRKTRVGGKLFANELDPDSEMSEDEDLAPHVDSISIYEQEPEPEDLGLIPSDTEFYDSSDSDMF